MRLLSAGLVYVAVSSLVALVLGMIVGGLNGPISLISLWSGALAGVTIHQIRLDLALVAGCRLWDVRLPVFLLASLLRRRRNAYSIAP